jgi:D-3-phosphoglycerate dehydrogenase/glyoxylate/hydroxypyruvate reductase A
VWTEDDVCDPHRVEALLAWRLKPGILPRYPGLRVLCSTGAGVDKLMVADLPPALPVTRVVDPLQAVQLTHRASGRCEGQARSRGHHPGGQRPGGV